MNTLWQATPKEENTAAGNSLLAQSWTNEVSVTYDDGRDYAMLCMSISIIEQYYRLRYMHIVCLAMISARRLIRSLVQAISVQLFVHWFVIRLELRNGFLTRLSQLFQSCSH